MQLDTGRTPARIGAATQRKDGRWQVRVGVGTRRRTFYGRTRAAAMDKAGDYAYRLQRSDSTVLLQDWMAAWLSRADVRDVTKESYERTVRRHVLPKLGRMELGELTPQTVQQWVDGINLSPRTVRYAHTLLRSALTEAVRMELLQQNPAQHVMLPRMQRADVRILTRPEARLLLANAGSWEAMFALTLGCGLRLSEVSGLQHKHLLPGVVRIEQSLRYVNGGMRLGPTKSKRSRRTVPIPAYVVPLLPHGEPDAFVFNKQGLPRTNRSVQSAWYRTCMRAAVRTNLHALRHTYATWLLQAGVPVVHVSRLLGHSSISTTVDVYGHIETETVDVSCIEL